jgi:hypothetical protein
MSRARSLLLALALAIVFAPEAAPAGRPPRMTTARWDSLVAQARYDSLVLALDRRPDAKRVRRPLVGGARSLEDLGRAFCWAIHHASPDSLYPLCVSEGEFAAIMWPEFPQSRAVTGLTAADAWAFLWPRNTSGIRSAVGDHEGRFLEFQRFESRAPVASYKNFKLHKGLVLVARNERGEEEPFDFLRSVIERGGRFKIYSMRD